MRHCADGWPLRGSTDLVSVPPMHARRQRPSHLICGLCPSITDTSIGLRFPHMLVLHAVLDHAMSVAPSRYRGVSAALQAPSVGGSRTGGSGRCCGLRRTVGFDP